MEPWNCERLGGRSLAISNDWRTIQSRVESRVDRAVARALIGGGVNIHFFRVMPD